MAFRKLVNLHLSARIDGTYSSHRNVVSDGALDGGGQNAGSCASRHGGGNGHIGDAVASGDGDITAESSRGWTVHRGESTRAGERAAGNT